jgi:alpha-N-arabinofuranosidase
LDSLEFARGRAESTWGSVRAAMGHPERFPLKYVAIGNEDCDKGFYRGNYLKFYDAIRKAYPDIQMISNCDGSSRPLDHPADLYDFHVYTSAANLFIMKNKFDRTSRIGSKVFFNPYLDSMGLWDFWPSWSIQNMTFVFVIYSGNRYILKILI